MSLSAQDTTIEVFLSYSHRDEALMQELVSHLSLLKRRGVIQAWHDRQITAGSEWEGQINEHLNSAQIVLLLISPDFLASDYCYDIELAHAIARHEKKQACVIPVILRPVDWQEAPFGKLQALPKNAQPITSWANRDEAFLDVTKGIRRVVEQMKSGQASSTTVISDRAVSVSENPTTVTSDPAVMQKQTGLSDSQKRRLKQRQNILESESDLRTEKLERLVAALAIEDSENRKFQLDKQIQAERDKLAEIGRELDEIEQSLL